MNKELLDIILWAYQEGYKSALKIMKAVLEEAGSSEQLLKDKEKLEELWRLRNNES